MKWIKRLTVAGMGVAVVLIAVEVTLRVAFSHNSPDKLRYKANPCFRMIVDRLLGHRYRGGDQFVVSSPEFEIEYRINSHGFRGPDFNPDPGAVTIALLGDSFTEGYGVEEDERFGDVLDGLLSSRADCPPVSIMNFGLLSFSPIYYLNVTRSLLTQFTPDITVLCLDQTDLRDDLAALLIGSFDRNRGLFMFRGQVGSPFKSPGGGLREMLVRNSHLAFLAGRCWKNFCVMRGTQLPDLYRLGQVTLDPESFLNEWTPVTERIAALERTVQGWGGEFWLVIYPWGYNVSKNDYPARDLRCGLGDEVYENYLEVLLRGHPGKLAPTRRLLLTESFREYRRAHDESELFFPLDGHLTVEGHRLMADLIAEGLLNGSSRLIGSAQP